MYVIGLYLQKTKAVALPSGVSFYMKAVMYNYEAPKTPFQE